MPHLTVEYSSNLSQFDAGAALLALNQALVAAGTFEELDIKSRAVRLDQFLVGTSPQGRAFVYVKLALLSGRSAETKQALSQALLNALSNLGAWPADLHVQLGVEILDMDRPSYGKACIG